MCFVPLPQRIVAVDCCIFGGLSPLICPVYLPIFPDYSAELGANRLDDDGGMSYEKKISLWTGWGNGYYLSQCASCAVLYSLYRLVIVPMPTSAPFNVVAASAISEVVTPRYGHRSG